MAAPLRRCSPTLWSRLGQILWPGTAAKPLGGDLIIGLTCYIADTEEDAYAAACPLLEEYQKMFAPLGFVRPITEEQIAMVADPTKARQAGLQTPREQGWVLGPPERVVERLLELEEQYPGLEEVMVGQPVGTPRSVLLAQLELLGTEVIPAFRERQAARQDSRASISSSSRG